MEEARKCFQSFAVSVFKALVAFHEVGFAHLDIRLPNICFQEHDGEWIAVLIDIDNAVAVEYGHVTPNSSSVMFNVRFDDNTKYNWRQYAIMLAHIIEGTDKDYHTREPHLKMLDHLKHTFMTGSKPHVKCIENIKIKDIHHLTLAELFDNP